MSTPTPFPAAPQAFRRLTAQQFSNSLGALLGPVRLKPVQEDRRESGLATVGARAVVTTNRGVEQYQEAIDDALEQVFGDPVRRSALLGCEPQATPDDACTAGFVQRFGRLAFRRALDADEVQRYLGVASAASRSLNDPVAGVRWAASAILQSPSFLYRLELGEPVAGQPGILSATSLELASRLAFFLWDAPPDDALLSLAEAGGLASIGALENEALRLAGAPEGKAIWGGFAQDFHVLSRLLTTAKDPALFPAYTPDLALAMVAEVRGLFEAAALDPAASALDIFTTRSRHVDLRLATLYGLPTAGLSEGVLARVEAPPDSQRTGLLASAGILSLYANQQESSPTLRGKFIREKLLCQTIPPPPPAVDTTVVDPPPGVVLSHRERLERHSTDPACASCHQLMDPPGFALEVFDAIGAYRTMEGGKPVDATGALDGVPFDGAASLGQVLANKPEAITCLVRSLYQYGTGSGLVPEAELPLRELSKKFEAGGHKLPRLAIDIVMSEGFRFFTDVRVQP